MKILGKDYLLTTPGMMPTLPIWKLRICRYGVFWCTKEGPLKGDNKIWVEVLKPLIQFSFEGNVEPKDPL